MFQIKSTSHVKKPRVSYPKLGGWIIVFLVCSMLMKLYLGDTLIKFVTFTKLSYSECKGRIYIFPQFSEDGNLMVKVR